MSAMKNPSHVPHHFRGEAPARSSFHGAAAQQSSTSTLCNNSKVEWERGANFLLGFSEISNFKFEIPVFASQAIAESKSILEVTGAHEPCT
jgi:hypothetical protein